MIHHLLLPLALVVAIGLCPGVARSQQNTSTAPAPAQQSTSSAENRQTGDAALREKAFELLESLAGQLNTLQSAENRARLGSNIAESLWTHDEKRARTLFAAVEADIKAGLQDRKSDDSRDEHILLVFLQLRTDTVERIAKHDPELAYAFLKATELNADTPRTYAVTEAERSLETRLAKQIAANNPDLALKLGRQSLARGFSHDLLLTLQTLYRKHREQGLLLYKEAIVELRKTNLAENWNATYFARVMAESLRPPLADDSAYRDLINIFITTALADGCDKTSPDEAAEFCNEIPPLWHQMEKIDPVRAALLKRWAPADESRQVPQIVYQELNELYRTGSVDEILALEQKYPQIKDQIYWQAMMKAQRDGDLERARKIATDFDGVPENRDLMLRHIEQAQVWRSINAEQLAEVQRKLLTRHIQERVMVLLILADRLGQNDRKTALMLLDQAGGMVDTMKPDKDQTQAQIALASLYCLEKSDRGLAIMEPLVPKLNELIAAASKLDGYDNRYLRDGEWNMSGEGGLGNLLTGLAKNAGYFAWCDFDRAVSLAAQFDRPEIRLMAQLKLAQGILAGPPKRLMMTSPLD